MAADLGVSPSYLNHIERNQRPVSAQLLLRLAETYDVDLRALGQAGGPATDSELTEILTDPVFQGLSVPRHEIVQMADDMPGAADALVRLYRAFTDRRARDGAGQRKLPLGYRIRAGFGHCVRLAPARCCARL